MNFTTTKHDRFTLVNIEIEKLGGVISPELKAHFVELNNQGEKNIILKMDSARYCDSSGLSAILVGNRLCKNANGTFQAAMPKSVGLGRGAKSTSTAS